MLIPNQIIEQKWNGANIPWFKQKGYKFTKRFDIFFVKVEDLNPGNRVKVEVECDICHKHFKKEYYRYIDSNNNGGDYCNKCKGIKTSETTKNNNKENLWNRINYACEKMNYKLISSYDDINGCKGKIKYECKIHGVKESDIRNFINLHGCNECGYIQGKTKTRSDINKIIQVIESVNNNILLNPNDYINAHTRNLKIKCGICSDGEFITCFNNYKKGQNMCEKCSRSMSKNERRIEKFLKSLNIEYIYEKTFQDCKDKKVLPFDFYLPQYNLCIEFDGEQHFNDHMYSTYSTIPYVNLEYTQKHDKIKNEYCANNNINLLRIPYYKENHIEEMIENKIYEIKLGIRDSLVS